jgi:hypothetical protein
MAARVEELSRMKEYREREVSESGLMKGRMKELVLARRERRSCEKNTLWPV